jgi:hypothetical protein
VLKNLNLLTRNFTIISFIALGHSEEGNLDVNTFSNHAVNSTDKSTVETTTWEIEKEKMKEEISILDQTVTLLKRELENRDKAFEQMLKLNAENTREIETAMKLRCDKKEKQLMEQMSLSQAKANVEIASCQATIKYEESIRKDREQHQDYYSQMFIEMRKEDAEERKMERQMRAEELQLVKGFIEAFQNERALQSSKLGQL